MKSGDMGNGAPFFLVIICNILMAISIMVTLEKTEDNEIEISSIIDRLTQLEGERR